MWKTNRIIANIAMSAVAAALAGCSRNADTSLRPSDQDITGVQAVQSVSENAMAAGDTIICEIIDDTLSVTHQDVQCQCCLISKIIVRRDGTYIDILEYDVGAPCDCICLFDLKTSITDLPPGDYTVRVWSEWRGDCGGCLVAIPGEARLSGFSQSDCLGNPKITSVQSGQDSVSAAFQNDTLLVSHFNSYYNCCQKIAMELEQEDYLLRFIEHPEGDLCHCMCYFNLSAEVTGLDPGIYVIQVWNEDRTVLFGQTEVTVPLPPLAKDGLVSCDPPAPGHVWSYRTEQGECKN